MSRAKRCIRRGAILFLIALLPVLIFMAFRTPTVRAGGGVIYTKSDGSSSSSCGDTWENACTLQTALSKAISGNEIWVKAGVYYPGINRADTFTLKNGVVILGGFSGMESDRNQRDWQNNKTILSGDIDQNDRNLDGNFIAETTNDIQGNNAYHVVTGSGMGNNAVLDGFIITAGQANGSSTFQDRGGGILNNYGSPKLANLIFSGNFATSYGGGIYDSNSSPLLNHVTFIANDAEIFGGGMFNINSSSPTLENSTFTDNISDGGGGLYNSNNSNPYLKNVVFDSNIASISGGGMYNTNCTPILNYVTFNNNSAQTDYGGGIYNDDSDLIITNVIFSENSTAGRGGAIYNKDSDPKLTNATFNENSAQYGGGMYNQTSNPELMNVTFFGNKATGGGGGMVNISNSMPALVNAILWGDEAYSDPEINNYSGGNPTISYSDIEGCGDSGESWNNECGSDGGANIDTDPLFVDETQPNLHLRPSSPVID